MRLPLSNGPKITRSALNNGYVTRYFVRNVSTGNITEIDEKQFASFKSNALYQGLQLSWVITGNAYDTYATDGRPVYGTIHKNTVTAIFSDKKLPGLLRLLNDPLRYFNGVYNQTTNNVQNTALPVSNFSTNASSAVTAVSSLERLELGRLFAQAGADILVAGAEEPFASSSWTSQTNQNPAAVLSDRLYLYSGGVAGNTSQRTYYINTVADRATAMMFSRLTQYSINNMLGRQNLRADIPNAQLPTRAIQSTVRNAVGSESYRIVERENDLFTQTVLGTTVAIPATHTLGIFAKGSDAATWATGSFGSLTRTMSGVAMQTAGKVSMTSANYAGSGTQFWINYSRINVHADTILRVTSNVAIRVQLLDASDNVLIAQNSVGDITDINLWDIRTTYCPGGVPLATKLQILNPTTLVVLKEMQPAERLWGGDLWQYTE